KEAFGAVRNKLNDSKSSDISAAGIDAADLDAGDSNPAADSAADGGGDAETTAGESGETSCVIHCRKRNEGFKTSSKVQYVARAGNFIDGGAEYTGALQILKVILSYDYL